MIKLQTIFYKYHHLIDMYINYVPAIIDYINNITL
jgi:hypothetical protein